MTTGAWSNGKARVSNTQDVGSTPTAPAIYIDNDSGYEVHADWWPGDPLPEQT